MADVHHRTSPRRRPLWRVHAPRQERAIARGDLNGGYFVGCGVFGLGRVQDRVEELDEGAGLVEVGEGEDGFGGAGVGAKERGE